ncbi:ABC transporter ATP-binding protein [Paucibacter sp. APW11]|uniref:ABC transporter ATP-binding protein n=1 Tax=Roseateles aquae TaxID=3077235 RepID=A0ABU3PDW8_9BURK|nr:ABC transporter ATP-binding protein [Paucibacter sp. APW11]MDT9000816.1 ABC transporter ATP-binding protein [Paucibacter sp. APW11]
MLTLKNLVKTYGALRAVDDVSLELRPGVVGLIGHNGAGKTTLMQMLATLSKPSSGQILLDGQDIVAHPELMRRRLGYLPQDFGVYPHLSALEFLQYFAALKGVRDPARIRRLLELVNLQDHAHRQAAGFSGGMRQRLGIAQALLNDPDVLIVDEPTAGLDPEERLRFRHLLSEIGFSKLVIVSTHIVSDVENMAGHLAIMRQGKLVVYESPEALLQRARGQVWSALLEPQHYESLRGQVHVLQAQRIGAQIQARISHASQPCPGALLSEPSLEEALMAQRYALQAA